MNDLQDAFVDAVDHLDVPDVDLTRAVLRRIEGGDAIDDHEPQASGERPASSRFPALVGIAVLLAVGLLVAATPIGDAVAAWFGIGATTLEVDDPDEGAADRPPASTHPLGAVVDPMPEASPIESLGRPDVVFDDARRGRTFVWNNVVTASEVRLSVRSMMEPVWSVKSLAAEDDVEFLTVSVPVGEGLSRPEPGVWIGAPHQLTYPVEGLDLELTVDAGPVLLWVHDDLELRLEGAADEEEALSLASQVLPGTELLPAG